MGYKYRYHEPPSIVTWILSVKENETSQGLIMPSSRACGASAASRAFGLRPGPLVTAYGLGFRVWGLGLGPGAPTTREVVVQIV